jgi:hypothetical protein
LDPARDENIHGIAADVNFACHIVAGIPCEGRYNSVPFEYRRLMPIVDLSHAMSTAGLKGSRSRRSKEQFPTLRNARHDQVQVERLLGRNRKGWRTLIFIEELPSRTRNRALKFVPYQFRDVH